MRIPRCQLIYSDGPAITDAAVLTKGVSPHASVTIKERHPGFNGRPDWRFVDALRDTKITRDREGNITLVGESTYREAAGRPPRVEIDVVPGKFGCENCE